MTEVLNVKHLGFTLLFIIISSFCLAQEETGSQSTEQTAGSQSVIGKRYIRDSLYVPLRSRSEEHRLNSSHVSESRMPSSA